VTSIIDQLVESAWDNCVGRKAAKDQEEAIKWQNDEYAFIKESISVQSLPSMLVPDVDKALDQWSKIEQRVLEELRMTQEQFLTEFERTRQCYLSGNNSWRNSKVLNVCVTGVVRNMEWVNLFGWMLPESYPSIKKSMPNISKMVTAIFYLELLIRRESPSYMSKIEVRWKMACSDIVT
jgi:hypothetical protein